MTILVTGGAGYIGAVVAWCLTDRGYPVTIVDDMRTGHRPNVPPSARFIEGDLSRPDVLEAAFSDRVEAILHFAALTVVPESIANPVAYYKNNVGVTLALLDKAVQRGVKRVIFSSTAAIYAPSDGVAVSERSTVLPSTPYGWSKHIGEVMLRDVSVTYGIDFGILRYFNVAGADPDMRAGQATPRATHVIKVACQAALGLRSEFPVYGQDYQTPDGTGVRDYIHVHDLAAAHFGALERLLQGSGSMTLNCGYGRGHSVLEIIETVERLTGRKLPVSYQPRRAGDLGSVVADASRIHEVLDWQPRYNDLDSIVGSALAWERKLLADPA